MNQKFQQKLYHANVNVNLIEENVIRSNDKRQCEWEKHNICEKDYICNIATCSPENGEYLASIIDNLVSTCDEIIE